MATNPDDATGNRRVIVWLLAVITVILVGWALRATYVVSMPLALAFLFAALLYPLFATVKRRSGQHWLATVTALLAILAVLALVVGAFWLAINRVASKLPIYVDKFQSLVGQVQQWLQDRSFPLPEEFGVSSSLLDFAQRLLAPTMSSIWEIVALLVLVVFFSLLMLLEVDSWRRKPRRVLDDHRAAQWLETGTAIAHSIRAYMVVRVIVSVISAVVTWLWLWLMGVDFALMFGLLAFLLNFIPNIGSVISGVLPTLFALLQFGFGWALLVGAGLFVIEQVIGNFVDPKLQGRSLDVSPLVVLTAVLFWGWTWGVIGAILGTPMTVAIIIACAHVESLRPVSLFLTREADADKLDAHAAGETSLMPQR